MSQLANRAQIRRGPRALIALAALGLGTATAPAAVIQASDDVGIAENSADSTDNDNTAVARHNPLSNADRNEWIALQFDLTGIDKSQVVSASVGVTMHRGNSNNNKTLALFATDGQTWDESTVTFNTMPGVTNDSNIATRGENLSIATDLAPDGFAVTGADLEGTRVELNPASLATYINGMTSNILSILISFEVSSNGTWNVATKEATTLASGAALPAGHAPALTVEVPEPASLSLLGLAGLALARRRRV